MKKQTTTLIFAALLGAGIAFAAAPSAIEEARIKAMVADLQQQQQMQMQMQQAQGGSPASLPTEAQLKAYAQRQLQSMDILKNAALEAKLDQDPEIQAQLANLQAEFYANAYAQHLSKNISLTEAEIQQHYRVMARQVKIQYVKLSDQAQAEQALDLLRKGMDFTSLKARFPNDGDGIPDTWLSPQEMPPAIAGITETMQRGQIKPIQLADGYYIFKLEGERNNPEAPAFADVKEGVAEQLKGVRVREAIYKLLRDNGIDPEAEM